MNKKPRFFLGLTGSIGMGKTTVSKMFRDLGVPVWCADTEVNKLYEKNGAATKLFSKEFPGVVTEKGVDKNKLRNLIHKDASILKKIEEIVHPLLGDSKINFINSNKDFLFVIFDIWVFVSHYGGDRSRRGNSNNVIFGSSHSSLFVEDLLGAAV